MDHRLAGRYRKRYSEVLAGGLGQVDTGEGSVEVELQSPKVSGLTVVETGVRFGIAKAELQLETRSVAVDYIVLSIESASGYQMATLMKRLRDFE